MIWRRTQLSNGLEVLLLPRQDVNTAQLSVAVEYGSNQEPQETAGAAHFLEHMVAGGSTKRIALSRSVEDSGGILDFFTDHEYMLTTMDVLPNELDETSTVLAELLFDLEFEEEKFRREKRIILNELAEASDDPAEKIEELLLNCLFKHHPIKLPVGGTPKTVKQLNLKELNHLYEANYGPENMILVLTGNFTEKNASAILGKFEAQPNRNTIPRKTFSPETETTKNIAPSRKKPAYPKTT